MRHHAIGSDSPDRQHLHRLEQVTFQPVFIIGDHRSGTTLLHRLLAETGCFNYVSAYDVMCYPSILSDHLSGRTAEAKQKLAQHFAGLGVKDRVIDNTPVSPDLPVEYGFILSSLQNRRPRVTPQTLPQFMELARKIQFISGADRPLLLKNPWDVLGFSFLQQSFPQARFVFIHRHPLLVLNSQFRAIQSLLNDRNEYAARLAPWYARLFERPVQLAVVRWLSRPPIRLWEWLLALHMVRAADYYLQHAPAMPKASTISLKYEELCADPDATMARILEFLRVQPTRSGSYRDQIEPRPPKVAHEAQHTYDRIARRLRPYLEYHEYGLNGPGANA